jgi:TonB family protein
MRVAKRFALVILMGCMALSLIGCPQKTTTAAAPPPPPSMDGVGHISIKDVQVGDRIGGADPIYPYYAQSLHLEGTVVAHIIIGLDGRITSLQTISSSDAGLTKSVLTTLQSWEFAPSKWNGQLVSVDANVEVKFTPQEYPYVNINVDKTYNFAYLPSN